MTKKPSVLSQMVDELQQKRVDDPAPTDPIEWVFALVGKYADAVHAEWVDAIEATDEEADRDE